MSSIARELSRGVPIDPPVGTIFGRWEVLIGRTKPLSGKGRPRCYCRCSCGTERWLMPARISPTGKDASQSCGCLRDEQRTLAAAERRKKDPTIGKRRSGSYYAGRRESLGLPRYTESARKRRRKDGQRREKRLHSVHILRTAELKMREGCVDCGYKGHPAALDFDHLPGFSKKAEISTMFRASLEDLMEEVAKCEVVCANCHRVRSAVRRGTHHFDTLVAGAIRGEGTKRGSSRCSS